MMKKLLYLTCISVSMLLCSCDYTKWDNYDELVGEWHSHYPPCLKKSRLIFNKDGTCVVENVPMKDVKVFFRDNDTVVRYSYSLFWKEALGNKKFQEKVLNLDSWNFHGFWKVKEDTLYDNNSKPYYRYRVLMSPHLEILGTKQMRDSFMNYTDADDAFWVEINAYTVSSFPPARLHYLSFYIWDPDSECCFFKAR